MLQTIKIGREDTNGAYGLIEVVVPAGVGSPWHVHPEEDEWFYVLEGELTVWVADTKLSLTPGSFAFGPKGVPHTFYIETGVARMLVGFAPMQFEGFQREVGEPALERVLPQPADGPPDTGAVDPDREAQRVRDPRTPRPAPRPLTHRTIRERARPHQPGPGSRAPTQAL
ncbi:MAG TPA: cupin domain-containing protein [Solirubrobacteraceae bacterium]|jgi:quercetin dioxygenase-like cupin family protein|nr:cupin domain-containing protein [Solirubrobacteraceae bacterium]